MLKVNPSTLIAIIGPTASGKTALAVKLARSLGGVVISADSRQLYRHARVGTNQPAGRWLKPASKWRRIFGPQKLFIVAGVPHFFIDELSPAKTFSAAEFQRRAYRIISACQRHHIQPIMVGGTGLYVSSIVEGYQFPSSQPNHKLRKKLESQSLAQLLRQLKRLDLVTYQQIDRANKRRVIRALEHTLTNRDSFIISQQKSPCFTSLTIGLNPDQAKLRRNIGERTRQMLNTDLINETKYLLRYYPNSTLLRTIGYQELIPHLRGAYPLGEAIRLINTHTWQYTRRQRTWFRRLPNVNWITNATEAQRLVRIFGAAEQNEKP